MRTGERIGRRRGFGARALVMPAGLALALVASGVTTACGRAEATTTTSAADTVYASRADAGDGGGPKIGALSVLRADAGPTAEDTVLPPANTEELAARMRHLLEAVVQGNGDLANDVVFPRDAYLLLRDTPDAAKLWEKKVTLPFRKSVEKLHKNAAKNGATGGAKYVGFELGHSVQQVSPKKKDWKSPVWRVKGSKLTFVVDGKPRQIKIAEMVAFRGAWYVTKL